VIPVVHGADAVELPCEVRDVARDQLHRVHADLEREVFRVDAKRIEADRLENIVAEQTLISAVDVGARECVHVADVKTFGRRVREHHQVIKGPRRVAQRVAGERVGTLRSPALLPLRFDFFGIVWNLRHNLRPRAARCTDGPHSYPNVAIV
jgi:hypothetical protein